MKKIFVIFSLVFLCSVCASTLAEEFYLHGSVTFDMSPAEMIETEQAKGYNATKVENSSLLLATEYGAGHTYDLSAYSSVYEIQGSFVSDGFSRIYYFFDKSDKLCQMLYAGTSCYKSAANVARINDALADLYIDKYGEWSPNNYNIPEVIDLQDIAALKIADDGFICHGLDLTDSHYQWFQPYGNSMYAEIELQGLKWSMWGRTDPLTKYYGYSYLAGYTRITQQDYLNSVENSINAVEQVMSDI